MQPGAETAVACGAASSTDPRREGAHAAILSLLGYALVLGLLAWPIAQVANPMLSDYPNHLARLHVAGALETSPTLARYYDLQPGLYPYLPFDLAVGALGKLIGLEPAGRLFILLALSMPLFGTLVLTRTLHGKAGPWPLVSALFAYNLLLSWGLVTFLFSTGIALMVFAGWIATRGWRWGPRLALFSVLSSAVFCSHPFAFSALGLMTGAWELGRTRAWSWHELRQTAMRLALMSVQFVPAVLLATQVEQTDVGSNVTFFGSLSARMTALMSPVLFAVDDGEIVLFCVLVLAFAWALRCRVLAFDRRMAWPVAVLAAGSLLMPAFLSGVYLVHLRLPLVLVLLLIASCRPQPQPRRTMALAAAAFAAVLAFRTSEAADRLAAADREIAELRVAATVIEEGARVLPVMTAARSAALPPNNYWHALAYLTVDRSAFYPLLFSFFNVAVAPEYRSAAAPATSPVAIEDLDAPVELIERRFRPGVKKFYWADWRRKFDYVVLFDFGQPVDAVPEGLALVRRGTAFAIYRIVERP